LAAHETNDPAPDPNQTAALALPALTSSAPIVIEGEDGTVIDGVRVSSEDGDCITIRDSSNITVRNSVIGPCAGRGIWVDGGSEISIIGNQIQTQYKPAECCDTGNGVYARLTSAITIDSNDIAYSESNVQLNGVTNAVVSNNTLANPLGPFPRGQQIQIAGSFGVPDSQDVLIEGNRLIASQGLEYNFKENQEDAINVYHAHNVTVRENDVQGGRSPSGCGILVDDSSNEAKILNNRVYNTAQCGIGIANGLNHVVDGNRVLLTEEVPEAGNTAIYTWSQYPAPCGGVAVTNNVATFLRADGVHSGFYDGGGCEPVTLNNNTFDEAAYAILVPEFADVNDRLLPEFFPLEYPRETNGLMAPVTKGLIVVALIGAAGAVVFYLVGRRMSLGRRHSA
jgi:nitrous oxidase accessory protein NosD